MSYAFLDALTAAACLGDETLPVDMVGLDLPPRSPKTAKVKANRKRAKAAKAARRRNR